MSRPSMVVALAVCLLPSFANAQTMIKIASWNGKDLYTDDRVDNRKNDLEKFGQVVKPDILLLQEIGDLALAKKIRDAMKLEGYHVVCSDFSQQALNNRPLEVAIISKFPLENLVEYDRSVDNKGPEGMNKEKRLERPKVKGIADIGVGRGFLYAEVKGKNLAIIVTHLKSSARSNEQEERDNARKRELVVAAIARDVGQKYDANKKMTFLVGGDFNVGETDKSKNGTELRQDKADKDGYDDTHAILKLGLIDGVKMFSLTGDFGFETYVARPFPGNGPIDCLYAYSKYARDFTRAQATIPRFGSDHVPVYTHFVMLPHKNFRMAKKPIIPRGPLALSKMLPNPEGNENQNEAVWILNKSDKEVDLDGWELRDARGRKWKLSGKIEGGKELKILRKGQQMPLGNSGTTVQLVNKEGIAVDEFSYGSTREGVIITRR